MRENLSPELLYETKAPATRGEGHVLRRSHLPLHRVRIARRGNGTTRSAAPGWVSIRCPVFLIAGYSEGGTASRADLRQRTSSALCGEARLSQHPRPRGQTSRSDPRLREQPSNRGLR